MKKKSQGRVSSRCSASRNRFSVISSICVEQAVLVLGAEVLDVDHVVADDLLDLVLQLGRIRVAARPRVGGQEARDHLAVDAARRVGLRDAEHDHVALPRREDVPDAGHAHGARVGELELVVRVVAPVAEAVEAERARAPRGRHHRPGRHGDRRVAGAQDAERAPLGERADGRQLRQPAVEDELGSRAVEPDHEDASWPSSPG